jgi:hypothetical protein
VYDITVILAQLALIIVVARIAGIAAFLAYGGGPVQQWIWMGKPTRAMAFEVLDAIIYGVITGCTMAWLWPHG